MRKLVSLAVVLGVGSVAAAAEPLPVPELFAPGVISGAANDGSPTFTADGNLLLFTRSNAGWSVVMESRRVAGRWTEPEVAAFSGAWPDSSPGIAPDGSYAVYVSLRPRAGAASGAREANLWRVDRVGSGWGTPVRLPEAVNIGPSIWKPSIGADGSVYFVSIDKAGGKRLYVATRRGDTYEPARPLPFSDGTTQDVDPEISRDGSMLVFVSAGRTKGDAKDRLFVVHKAGTGWGEVKALRYAGDDAGGTSTDDEPHLGPDGKTLYFSSDRAPVVAWPRTHDQAVKDVARMAAWDNGNANVWMLQLVP